MTVQSHKPQRITIMKHLKTADNTLQTIKFCKQKLRLYRVRQKSPFALKPYFISLVIFV